MKRLRLTLGHHPPANPSLKHRCDTVWLLAFAESKAPGKKGIEAADRAEREFLASHKKEQLSTN